MQSIKKECKCITHTYMHMHTHAHFLIHMPVLYCRYWKTQSMKKRCKSGRLSHTYTHMHTS